MAKVPAPWLRLIAFVEEEVPHGEVIIKIADGLPQKLLGVSREIRFDRPDFFEETEGRIRVKGRGLGVKSGA
ncbi:MAG: hypothetical protein CVV27_02645 [Candidatus Melainabacteria bacterium HGW-Melainabacteria-1]|nr:MAG: hypothetical protein CVV27_02645 [Candidatus Melainabacteria bacterium HGW-Melainabacteria-1]